MANVNASSYRAESSVVIGESVYMAPSVGDDVTINGRRYLVGGTIETNVSNFDINIFQGRLLANELDVSSGVGLSGLRYGFRDSNGTVFLFGNVSGGVLARSANNGSSWGSVNHQQGAVTMRLMAESSTNRLLILGDGAAAAYSDDGGNVFTDDAGGGAFGSTANGLAYGEGYFVACKSSEIAYSADGLSWTTVAVATSGFDVSYGGGEFVMAGGLTIHQSADGITWNLRVSVDGANFNQCAFGNGVHIVTNLNGGVMVSSNASVWESYNTPSEIGSIQELKFNSDINMFIAVGDNGAIMTTVDGVTWNVQNTESSNQLIYGSASLGGSGAIILMGNNDFVNRAELIRYAGLTVGDSKGSAKKYMRVS